MDYREMLGRYINRRVCVSTFGHNKLFGELAAVNEDCLRLVDTTLSGDSDDQWLAQSQYSDPDSNYGVRHAETIIHFHHIVSITCLDDDLPGIEDFSSAASEAGGGEGGMRVASHVAAGRPATIEIDRTSADEAFSRLVVDRLEIRLGSGLIPIADAKRGGDLVDRVQGLRSLITSQLGFILPHTRMRDDTRLDADEFRIFINGAEVSRGVVRPGKVLAISNGQVKTTLEGERTLDPAFLQPAVWIDPANREAATLAGYLVVEPSAVLVTQLQREVRRHAGELFSLECLRALLEFVRQQSPAAVDEVVPMRFTLSRLHDLLSRLLEEDVSLRPMEVVLEKVAQLPDPHADLEEQLVTLRSLLGRSICEPYRDGRGKLSVFTLDAEVHRHLSQILLDDLRRTDGYWLARFVESLREWYLDRRSTGGREVPLIVDAKLRRRFKQFIASQIPTLAVLSYSEIPSDLPVQLVATLDENELGLATRQKKPRRQRVTSPVAASGGEASVTKKVRRPR